MPAAKKSKSKAAELLDRMNEQMGGPSIHGLAKELSASLDGIASELRPIEQGADYIGNVASALDNLANAIALQAIAQHGDEEDRAKAIAKLKGWFEEFRE